MSQRAVRGSSLIEVMVASSILLIVLTSTSMAIAFGVRHVGHTRRVAEAERIAASQMEALLIEGRRNAPLLDNSGRFATPRPRDTAGRQRFSADGRADKDGDYFAKWTIQLNKPVEGGLRLRVDVTWDEDGQRGIGLTTYFVLPDPCDLPDDDDRRGGGGFGGGRGGGGVDPCDRDDRGFGGGR